MNYECWQKQKLISCCYCEKKKTVHSFSSDIRERLKREIKTCDDVKNISIPLFIFLFI